MMAINQVAVDWGNYSAQASEPFERSFNVENALG